MFLGVRSWHLEMGRGVRGYTEGRRAGCSTSICLFSSLGIGGDGKERSPQRTWYSTGDETGES